MAGRFSQAFVIPYKKDRIESSDVNVNMQQAAEDLNTLDGEATIHRAKQADPSSTSTAGERHVSDAQTKKWEDHVNNGDAHVTAAEKTAWQGHVDDGDLHVTAVQKAGWDGKEDPSNKGQPSGYAGLGADGKTPEAQLPDVMTAAKTFNDRITFGDEVVFDGLVDNLGTTISWGAGNKQKKTLTGNVTLAFSAPSGPTGLQLELIQEGTAYSVLWPSSVRWIGGNAPDLSGTNKLYVVSFLWDGTYYIGSCGGGA